MVWVLGYLKNVVLKVLLCWRNSLMSHLLKGLYQMTGDKQIFTWSLRKVKNVKLLTIDRCRCKTLEHIIVSNINRHSAFDSLLADCQLSFWSQRSYETQLVQFFHNIINNLDGAINRNINIPKIMDFTKAFDKVPHSRYLYKLHYYGISRSTYNPASILRKSISGRHRPVSYPDGPMTARYRFT